MIISTKEILQYLEENEIRYSWNQKEEGNYTIASLFEPINYGFYFYTGSKPFHFNVSNSVIITQYPSAVTGSNQFIIVEDLDAQQLFYKLLSTLYSRNSNNTISPLSEIHPEARIGKNVQIDAFCSIEKCIIEDNCIIGSHSKIHANTIVGECTIIESHSTIGTQGVAWVWDEMFENKIIQPQLGGVSIGKNCFIGASTIIVRGSLNENTVIGQNVFMAPGCRIGHGTRIGNLVHFANNVITGGNAQIGDGSFIGSGAIFTPKVVVDTDTIVGAGAVVVKNTSKSGLTLMGTPAKEFESKEAPRGMPKPKMSQKIN